MYLEKMRNWAVICVSFLFMDTLPLTNSLVRNKMCSLSQYHSIEDQTNVADALIYITEGYFISGKFTFLFMNDITFGEKNMFTIKLLPKSDLYSLTKVETDDQINILQKLNYLHLFPIMVFGQIVHKLIITNHTKYEFDQFIIFLKGEYYLEMLGDLRTKLEILELNSFKFLRGRLVIVSSVIMFKEDVETLNSHVFPLLWKHKICDAIVLVNEWSLKGKIEFNSSGSDCFGCLVNVYTWFPFDPKNECGKRANKIILLDSWMSKKVGFKNNVDLFPNKIPNSLNGCTICVSTIKYPPNVMYPIERDKVDQITLEKYKVSNSSSVVFHDGIEVRLLQAIAATANFKIEYRPPASGWWMHIMASVEKSECEVGFGSYFRFLFNEKLESTVTYLKGGFKWFVSNPKRYPQWSTLIRIFTLEFWIMVLASYLLASIVMYIIPKLGKSLGNITYNASYGYNYMSESFLNNWGIILGIALVKIPSSRLLSILFLIWMWYCFLINSAYKSFLVIYLVKPSSFSRIRNVEELVRSGMKYGMLPASLPLMEGDDDKNYKIIIENYVPCESAVECFDKLAFEGDFAFAYGTYNTLYALHSQYMRQGVAQFYEMEEDVKSGHVAMYLSRGSLYLKRFSDIISRLLEAGVILKWQNDFTKNMVSKRIDNNTATNIDDNNIVLTMYHLQGPFLILMIGLGLSLILFIGERWPLKSVINRM